MSKPFFGTLAFAFAFNVLEFDVLESSEDLIDQVLAPAFMPGGGGGGSFGGAGGGGGGGANTTGATANTFVSADTILFLRFAFSNSFSKALSSLFISDTFVVESILLMYVLFRKCLSGNSGNVTTFTKIYQIAPSI